MRKIFHCGSVIDSDVDEEGHQAGCTAMLASAGIGFLPSLSTAPPWHYYFISNDIATPP